MRARRAFVRARAADRREVLTHVLIYKDRDLSKAINAVRRRTEEHRHGRNYSV